jgi:hypothetical protein
MQLGPDDAAAAVERHPCPQCDVPAGSACRTRAGKTAAKYHTARSILVPPLRDELTVPVPADQRPGTKWTQGPEVAGEAGVERDADPDRLRPLLHRHPGTAKPARRARGRALHAGVLRKDQHPHQDPTRTREGPHPRQEFKTAAPDQPVILTVHEMKRLARNAAELMSLSAQFQGGGVQLELLTGPLTGIYDPHGMGSMLFAVLAVAAQLDRDYIREKTLEGQRAAAARGNHGGRPKVLDEDDVLFARALRDKGTRCPTSSRN